MQSILQTAPRATLALLFVFGGVGCDTSSANVPDAGELEADEATASRGEPREANDAVNESNPLESHAWEHRPVVIFAPGPSHSQLERQNDILRAHADGVTERDIVVYRVYDDSGEGPDATLPSSAVDALRERFGPHSDFVFILVGKDTTEKLRRPEVVSAERLFETIDAMPMRRREMREDE